MYFRGRGIAHFFVNCRLWKYTKKCVNPHKREYAFPHVEIHKGVCISTCGNTRKIVKFPICAKTHVFVYFHMRKYPEICENTHKRKYPFPHVEMHKRLDIYAETSIPFFLRTCKRLLNKHDKAYGNNTELLMLRDASSVATGT